ncbi:MAG: sigma-70 family RNA polymerase sigma factor [Scytonematopsis contorta HA4267-MV1]|jgi:RNA polymerase sigma factor (sigma-70 family)|nr:sigma-70 family RNA polymerase sigma factor [Scytonematopsis contorta HA4267-MV1]
MTKREGIIQKFSTFASFTKANSIVSILWQVDVELERHIKKIKQSDPEAKEKFWAIYFLRSTLNAPQIKENQSFLNKSIYQNNESENSQYNFKAERHLFAYLQESCLWAAYKVHKKFSSIRYKYPLEECFQIACMGANPPSNLLKNFNLNFSSSIDSYAKTALVHFIQNTIYSQDIEVKTKKYSDYGLLKDLTKIELKTALMSQGIAQQEIDLYCIVWKCFDEVYSSKKCQSNRSLKSPNQEQIKQICSCYNLRLQKLNISVIPASEEQIQQILSTCIQAAREYRTKYFLPLDKYEDLPNSQPNNLDNLVQEETWEQVLSVLSQIFINLPEAVQVMFKLSKGLNLTQSEVADVLKDKYSDLQKQYQVARQLAKHNRNILGDFLMQWQLVEPDVPINDEKDIENIKLALDECLENYCQKMLNNDLELVLSQLVNEKRNKINADSSIKQEIIRGFNHQLETNMYLPNKCLESVEDKVTTFVDEWLKTKSYYINY